MNLVEDGQVSILLVEDDALDEALLVSMLQHEGLSFVHSRVATAEAFQASLVRQNWDVIISDYNLPVFSAEEVLKILEGSEIDVPCIVISGCIGEEAAVSLMKAGAHDFVGKSNLARLVPAIRRELAEVRNRRDKREIEQTLRRKEKMLASIAAALGEGLAVTDKQGRVIFVNPEAERLLGWNERDIVGRNLHHCIHYLKEDGSPYPEQECPVATYAPQGAAYRSEDEIFVRKDGTTFHVSYVATPLIEDGKVIAVVTAFQDISRRKRAEHELIESRRSLRALSNFLQTVREEERARIARELHDELGQALTALKMDVSWMMSRFSDEQDTLLDKADGMMTLIDSTVESVRRIAANLRPGLLDDLGLAAAVEWLLEEFTQRTGVPYRLQLSHDEFDFDSGLSITVFRILQEAITNVARYAQASRLQVEIEDRGGNVTLTVADDGIGFDPQGIPGKRKSFGLLGIRERVNALGGRFDLVSKPGIGTELRVELPKAMAH